MLTLKLWKPDTELKYPSRQNYFFHYYPLHFDGRNFVRIKVLEKFSCQTNFVRAAQISDRILYYQLKYLISIYLSVIPVFPSKSDFLWKDFFQKDLCTSLNYLKGAMKDYSKFQREWCAPKNSEPWTVSFSDLIVFIFKYIYFN